MTALALSLVARPDGPRDEAQEQARVCQTNLKSLATACELYGTDWGNYPPTLQRLTLKGLDGGYLKSIPTCPAAQADTYSGSYQMKMPKFDKQGEYVAGIDHFRLGCAGHHHKLANYRPNRPAYDCKLGLIIR